MTTLAYREGILAGDTLVTFGNSRVGRAVKVERFGDLLIGCAGELAHGQALVAWIKGGCEGDMPAPKTDSGGEVVVIAADNIVTSYERAGVDSIEVEFYAIGSGAHYAYGAMAMGATAEEAVRIAARFDVKTGGDVMSVAHGVAA